jgi:anti-sigma-K factor RskA
MSTNNPTNHSGGSAHPEDMLEAFTLDSLDLDEAEQVQDHLDGCFQCSEVVDRYQETAASLAQLVNPQEPPPGLRARLMQAVSREVPETPAGPAPQFVPPLGDRLIGSRLFRVLVPTAASVAMVLVVLAVAMNLRISGQVDDLKQENASLQARLDDNMATTTVQLNAAAAAESEVMDSVLKLQQASFELAQPDNMSLELRSRSAESRSQGILLVSSDGNRGVIMVAGMEPPSPSTIYHIWLMRGQDKVWAGKLDVDSRGWGTVLLQLREPIMGFEKVELTSSANSSASQPQSDMVLEGNLVSMNAPRLVTFAPLR